MTSNPTCHFCNLDQGRIVASGKTCMVIRDQYPVTPLHTLIITKRHVATYFDLTEDELREIHQHVETQRANIEQIDPLVSAFNIGMNCGEDAGQTVMHFHAHLIPRRKGDIDNPRGGVRGVIPNKRIY